MKGTICDLPAANADERIALDDAGLLFPGGRSRSTIWRYADVGYRGVILQTFKIAGARMTTRGLVEKFIEQTSEAAGFALPAVLAIRSRGRQRDAARKAAEALEKEGLYVTRKKKAGGRSPPAVDDRSLQGANHP